MADEGLRPIIVKRIKKSGGGAHGGAWKIAYADFVTAMMAFFLLMWLLGSTSKGDLNGIAEYFKNPLRIAMAGGEGSGDSDSVIKGGGTDLSKADGKVNKSEAAEKKTLSLKAAKEELIVQDAERLKTLKSKLEEAIESKESLKQYRKQLLIDITTEGLRIQVVDEKNRPMFGSASAQIQPYTRDILREIGALLNDMPNKISLSGHTDATPYSTGERSYSNWELSADRANASRRELIIGGMDESHMVRVVGLASALPLDKEDLKNPINRRISIIVMNRQAEESFNNEGNVVNVTNEDTGKSDGSASAPAPRK